MPQIRLLALLSLATLAATAAPGLARQATPAASPMTGAATTAIVVSATNDPFRAAGSDGRDHLEYDLLVTNGFVAPVTLTSIEVVAPDGESLLLVDGEALATATQPLLSMGPTAEIPASGTVAVVMDIAVPPDRELESLSHRIAYDVALDAPARSLIGSFEVEGPQLPVDSRPAIVIAPPLRGDGWLAGNGCCSATSIHRAIRIPVNGDRIGKQETFAIDWIRLHDGKIFDGNGSQNEQWFAFGAEVFAVADGTVVAVTEGHQEETPLQPVTGVHSPGDYGGNSISIEIAPGVYAFYAHLQPGSITVKEGDQVTSGQLLGLLGNTGNSTGPHLHFGLIDDPDPLIGESLPMIFDNWTLEGRIDQATYEGGGEADTPPALIPEGGAEPQSATLQLYLDVADFG